MSFLVKGALSNRWVEAALFLTALVVVSAYGISELPILKDMGFFSYIGQEISRGYAPYTTVYEVKPPLLFYFYAVAMNVFWFLPQYMSIRVFMLAVIGVSVVLFYRILLESTGDRLLSAIAALVYISFNYAMELALLGDSKAMAIVFSSMATLLAFRSKYMLSGACAAVAGLFWQPFTVFLLVPASMLVLEGDLRPLKIGRFARVAIGFAIPIAVLVLYFALAGSLSDLLNFSLIYPLKYEYASIFTRTLWNVLKTVGAYSSEFFYLVLGGTGLVYTVYTVTKSTLKGRAVSFFTAKKELVSYAVGSLALALALANYYEAGSQFSVLLPALSALAAFVMVKIAKWASAQVSALAGLQQAGVWRVVVAVLIALTFAYGFFPALQPVYPENPLFSERNNFIGVSSPYALIAHMQDEYGIVNSALMFLFRRPGESMTLQDQLKLAQFIQDSTAPDEKILSLNAPEILFLSGRRNLNQYPLYEGAGFYELSQERGELDKIVSDATSSKPKFIIYTSDSFVTKLGLGNFVESNYVKHEYKDYDIYVLRGVAFTL